MGPWYDFLFWCDVYLLVSVLKNKAPVCTEPKKKHLNLTSEAKADLKL